MKKINFLSRNIIATKKKKSNLSFYLIKKQHLHFSSFKKKYLDLNNTDRFLFENALKYSDKVQSRPIQRNVFNKDISDIQNTSRSSLISKKQWLFDFYTEFASSQNLVLRNNPRKNTTNKVASVMKGYVKSLDNENVSLVTKKYLFKENQLKNKIIIDLGSQLTTLSYKNFIIEQRDLFQVRKISNEFSGKKTHIFNFLKTFCKYSFSSNEIDISKKEILFGNKENSLSWNTEGLVEPMLNKTYSKRLNIRLKKTLINNSINNKKFNLNKNEKSTLSNSLFFSKLNTQNWGQNKLFYLKKELESLNSLEKNELNIKNIKNEKKLILCELLYKINFLKKRKKKTLRLNKDISSYSPKDFFSPRKEEWKNLNNNQLNFYEYLHKNFYKTFPYYKKINVCPSSFSFTPSWGEAINLKHALEKKNKTQKKDKWNPLITLKYTNLKSNTLFSFFLNLNFNWEDQFDLSLKQKEDQFKKSINTLKKKDKMGAIGYENYYWIPFLEKNSYNKLGQIKNLEHFPWNNKKEITEPSINTSVIAESPKSGNLTPKIIELLKQKKMGTQVPITILITLINRLIHPKAIEYIFKTNNIYSSILYLKYYSLYLHNHFYPQENGFIETVTDKKKIQEIYYQLLTQKQNTLWNNNLSKKMLSTHWYINHFKLRYYSKIIHINRLKNLTKALNNNHVENNRQKARFNIQNKNTIKKANIKGGYTKRLISFYLYKKKTTEPVPSNFGFNIMPLKQNNINDADNKALINKESSTINQLRTDIALNNTLNLINLTF